MFIPVALIAAAAAVARVPTVTLKNGVKMPMIASGTYPYNLSEAYESVSAALKVGFSLIDTALTYRNQESVGKAIADSGRPRDSIFVTTKVPGCGIDGISSKDCYADTQVALERNLHLLNMSYVDLVLIHFPPLGTEITRSCTPVCSEIRDQWKAFEEFYAAGKARAIGVSNYCPSCFKCLDNNATVFPMVNQVQYHIGMGPDPAGFKSEADKRGVVLQGYAVLGNKPWRGAPDPDILGGEFTTGLAHAHNKSTVQVALKYMVSQGIPAVTKSLNPAHLAADLDLWSWDLTAAELDAANKYKIAGTPEILCNVMPWELKEARAK